MKHINFDESLVLREFARIAGEKGLIKVAAQALPPVGGQATFTQILAKFPAVHALAANQQPQGGPQQVYNQMMKFFPIAQKQMVAGNIAKDYTRLAKPLLDKIVQYLQPHVNPSQLQQLKSKVQPFYQTPNKESEIPDFLMQNDDGVNANIVQAAKEGSGVYDVSGETGEDLVDQAHPGGGTRTELTHSKTDENLVETIVEQQEKDVDVAHKVPKGTYATLRRLYEDLSKMGYSKNLDQLRSLINKIATEDEVIGYTLITLADKLDKLGNKEAADKVDSLLKKKRFNLDKIAENAMITFPDGSTRYIDSNTLENLLQGGLPMPALTPIPSDNLPEPALVAPPGRARDPRVAQWQKAYNSAIGGTGLSPLAVDGLRGQKTNAAMQKVRQSGARR